MVNPSAKNPYGVKGHGRVLETGVSVLCRCCRERFTFRGRAMSTPIPWCRACLDHHPTADEPVERHITRAEDHAKRFRSEAHRERGHVVELQLRAERAAATSSSLHWALADLRVKHTLRPSGKCDYCQRSWPCGLVKAVDKAMAVHTRLVALELELVHRDQKPQAVAQRPL